MDQSVIWEKAESYFQSKLHKEDDIMEAVLRANHEAGLSVKGG